MGWWSFGPNEFVVLVAFGKDADEAWLAIEDSAYVGWCHSRVAPSIVHGQAKLIFWCVPGAVVEAIYASDGAPCKFV